MASGSPEELQQMMQGKTALTVTVIGEKEQAEAVLAQMEEVTQYHFEAGEEEGSIVIHIETKEDADIRKALSVALAGAGMPILSMSRSERSLEDIFLELTEAGPEVEMEEEAGSEDEMEMEEEPEAGPVSEIGIEEELETEGGERDGSDL